MVLSWYVCSSGGSSFRGKRDRVRLTVWSQDSDWRRCRSYIGYTSII